MTRPVLIAPDLDKEFRVEADTSNYVLPRNSECS